MNTTYILHKNWLYLLKQIRRALPEGQPEVSHMEIEPMTSEVRFPDHCTTLPPYFLHLNIYISIKEKLLSFLHADVAACIFKMAPIL